MLWIFMELPAPLHRTRPRHAPAVHTAVYSAFPVLLPCSLHPAAPTAALHIQAGGRIIIVKFVTLCHMIAV